MKISPNSVGISRNSDKRFSEEAASRCTQKTLSLLVAVYVQVLYPETLPPGYKNWHICQPMSVLLRNRVQTNTEVLTQGPN